ncbi:MAG: hypothetical protein Kilf2KO_13730 [Rhodospirillales bacterium]
MTQPQLEMTTVNRPYWEGLAAGVLRYQRCPACDATWLPPRAACPACLAPEPAWCAARGDGSVVSWVVYHHAYAAHLTAKLPYNVAIVELDEGPRLLTNVIAEAGHQALQVGARVKLAIETDGGQPLARFRLEEGSTCP